jgi:hypothetical protein
LAPETTIPATISATPGRPNPCTDSQFNAPIYEFSNLTIVKDFFDDYGPYPDRYLSTVKFVLRDLANNFTFHCNWNARNPAAGPSWETQDCVADEAPTASHPQVLTLLNLWPEFLMMNKSMADPITIVQYWYCDISNGSYP